MDSISRNLESSIISTTEKINLKQSVNDRYPAISSNRYRTKTISPSRVERKNYNILGLFDKNKQKKNIRKNTNAQRLPIIDMQNNKKADANSVSNTNKLMKLPAYSNFHGHNIKLNKFENFGGLVLGVNRQIKSKIL